MSSKKKPLEVVALDGLGLDASEVGSSGSPTSLVSWAEPDKRQAGQKFEGESADELVGTLMDKLANDAKVI